MLARKYGDVDAGYEALAEKYIEVAESKDPNILKDVADRSDGKPRQAFEHSGPEGEDGLPTAIRVELVKPGA